MWVRLATTHGDKTCTLIVLGPAEAADPLGADLVEEDRVDVDREAIGGGVKHAIHHVSLLQFDCHLLQLHIDVCLCNCTAKKLELLASDLVKEGFVYPVKLEVALGAGGLLRGDDLAVLNICLVRVGAGVGISGLELWLWLGLGLRLG